MVTVYTKEQLEREQQKGATEIRVEGDLAKHLHRGKAIVALGKTTLVALGTAIAGIPFTGGLSTVAVLPIAALTGIEVALIMATVAVGLGLLLAIWQEYEEIEFELGPPPVIRLRRKRR